MFGKIYLPCSPSREYKAMLGYINCEKELRQYEQSLLRSNRTVYTDRSQFLDAGAVSPRGLRPLHGLGRPSPETMVRTADHLSGTASGNLSKCSSSGDINHGPREDGEKLLSESCFRPHHVVDGSVPVRDEPQQGWGSPHPRNGIRQSKIINGPRGRHDMDAAILHLFGREGGLRDLDHSFYAGNWSGSKSDLTPRHGSGRTADRLSGNQKYNQIEWPQRLDEYFPLADFLIPNYSHEEWLDRFQLLEPGSERPVKVTSVPKTLKTPRIIAMEPTAMQYAQQAIMRWIYEWVKKDSLLSTLIGFQDQIPNRELALKGSCDGSLATLDLSEASDRVLNQHVVDLFKFWPHLSGAVQACRSTKADVPGFGVIPLAKFASMGSGLTFPIEAMLFLCSVITSIAQDLRVPVTDKFIKSLVGKVRVYGDDIIVPVEHVASVIAGLESLGLKINRNKSFWTGKFRESCGGDYYDGVWVTPIRLRRLFPSTLKDVPEIISIVSFRNQLFTAGYLETVQWLDNKIVKVLPHFPVVHPTSPILGRHDFSVTSEKYCEDLHCGLAKGYVVRTRSPKNSIDGVPALLKWFLEKGSEPLSIDHLERSGRPEAVYLKLRWAPTI
nr:MAG: hypothetical protein 3 [Leviviridae sp.]